VFEDSAPVVCDDRQPETAIAALAPILPSSGDRRFRNHFVTFFRALRGRKPRFAMGILMLSFLVPEIQVFLDSAAMLSFPFLVAVAITF